MASLPEARRLQILGVLSDDEVRFLAYDWEFWARPNQLAPEGDWLTWLVMAGRGFGKTRTGAQWVHKRAMAGTKETWIALIGADPAEVRNVMVEVGPSSILKNVPPWELPLYEPAKKRLTWPNGAHATIYSAEQPEELRGFSGDTAWLDEPAKFKHLVDVMDNLLFGLREAKVEEPRLCLTTTPKPLKVLKDLLAEAKLPDPSVVVTGGSSYENRANLSPKFFKRVIKPREGTALAQQEILGRMLDQMPGAKWERKWIEEHRVRKAPSLDRIVVAVDPPGGATECGIIVAGVRIDHELEHFFVLDDLSTLGSPDVWGKKAVEAYKTWMADTIVAEINFGGDMVAHVIHAVDKNVPVKVVRASRGKAIRAEPVSALYEGGRGHHVRDLPKLEDELCTWEPDSGMESPNRLDACVWAASELILGAEPPAEEEVFDPGDVGGFVL